jgi:membrane-bound lytic murein transglycosylase D
MILKNQFITNLKENNFLKPINKFILRIRYNPKYSILWGGILISAITLICLIVYSKLEKSLEPNHHSSYIPEKKFFSNPVEEKIYWLNQKTPLELVYNSDVENYIDLYLNERQKSLKYMLARADVYFPIIEAFLDKYNMPLELKYLAALESGLNPLAQSKSGAYGLWQHLYSTCSLLDLEVNSYIDDRYDVYKSTEAACRYLQYLYRIFNNWELAMAAYNDGPGTVSRAIARSGGITDYWQLREYLPFQSSEYIPAFIAFNYLFEYYSDYHITFKKPENIFTDIDTIWINASVNFEQIAYAINVSVDDLRKLNPRYKKNFVPRQKEPAILILPKDKIMDYLWNEEKIVTSDVKGPVQTNNYDTSNMIYTTHIVQKGEFYHKLALKYNCTIESIKKWNHLDDNELYPGQTLTIWITEK